MTQEPNQERFMDLYDEWDGLGVFDRFLTDKLIEAEAARDRQYEYNVEQIAKQAALEARIAKLGAALREAIPYVTPHVMKGRLKFALSEQGLVESKKCANCGEDNYEFCRCDRT